MIDKSKKDKKKEKIIALDCAKNTIVFKSLSTPTHENDTFLLVPEYCGTWECDDCSVRKKEVLRSAIQAYATRDKLFYVWTITSKLGWDDLKQFREKLREKVGEMHKETYIKNRLRRKKTSTREEAEEGYENLIQKIREREIELNVYRMLRADAIKIVEARTGFQMPEGSLKRELYAKDFDLQIVELRKNDADIAIKTAIAEENVDFDLQQTINHPLPFRYIRVTEIGKNGHWHDHIICNYMLPKFMIDSIIEREKEKGIHDIYVCDNLLRKNKSPDLRDVTRYVTKVVSYITKDTAKGMTASGLKVDQMIGHSDGYSLSSDNDDEKVSEWKFEGKFERKLSANSLIIRGDIDDVNIVLKHPLTKSEESLKILDRIGGLETKEQARKYVEQRILQLSKNKLSVLSLNEREIEKLTDDQKNVVQAFCTNNIVVLNARAGTGKTTTVSALVRAIPDLNAENTAFVASAGKAVARIQELLPNEYEAQTIHRFLGAGMGGKFKKSEKNTHEHLKFLIIDETAMLDALFFAQLLCAMRDDVRILCIGDSRQLPPIDGESVMHLLGSIEGAKVVKLDKVMRSGDTVLEIAHNVLAGISPVFEMSDFHDDLDWQVEKAVKASFEGKQILTNSKRLELHINSAVQALKTGKHFKGSGYNYYLGDRVQVIKSDNLKKVKNGESGIVVDIQDKTMTLKMQNGREIRYTWKQTTQLQPAYALTVHKAQGSEFDDVFIMLEYVKPKRKNGKKVDADSVLDTLHCNNMLYTACTRAKCSVEIIADPLVMDIARSTIY